ncbi:hypothetical protein LJE86_08455 [bacterium BMS3Abin03]|jgi:hypothetical protein|nr:hypothetical protein [bacterium BMS3Abin03]MCG6960463.1 hypothetical protein [bacterium BMS3Abin03]
MKYTFMIILTALLLLSGCDNDPVSSNEYEYEEQEFNTIDLTAQTELIVENTNGSITILDSDTAKTIQVEIRKKVRSKISERDAKSHISDINVSPLSGLSSVRLSVNNPSSDDRDYEINIEIILPKNFNYDLALGNGTINITSETKNINLSLGNGTVEADLVLADNCEAGVTVGNGTINFKVPNNTNAMFVASVGNGSIVNNGLSFQNQQTTSRTFSGRLGNGNGSIVLSLGNGTITMLGN